MNDDVRALTCTECAFLGFACEAHRLFINLPLGSMTFSDPNISAAPQLSTVLPPANFCVHGLPPANCAHCVAVPPGMNPFTPRAESLALASRMYDAERRIKELERRADLSTRRASNTAERLTEIEDGADKIAASAFLEISHNVALEELAKKMNQIEALQRQLADKTAECELLKVLPNQIAIRRDELKALLREALPHVCAVLGDGYLAGLIRAELEKGGAT